MPILLCFQKYNSSLLQSCPRVTFLGPDPTRRDPAKSWPDPTHDCRQKVWPDPTRGPTHPHMCFFKLNNYLLIILLLCIKYRRKSINSNVVFEELYRFRYKEIIREKLKNPKCWSDPTWPDPPTSGKSWPDPTRPDPRVHPTRTWTTLVWYLSP